MTPGNLILLNGASSAGNNVIADHVLIEAGWVQECALQIKQRIEDGPPPQVFKLLFERIKGHDTTPNESY